MTDKVLYEELTPGEFLDRLNGLPVAYLPLGTLEWHGVHLPLGADGLQSQGFFKKVAAKRGGIVLPALFLGPDTHKEIDGVMYYGMDFLTCQSEHLAEQIGGADAGPMRLAGSAYHVPDEFFVRLLDSVMWNLARAGFKMVVAHGHGPSVKAVDQNAARWEKEYGLKVVTCWFFGEPDKGLQVDHAGVNETSITMYLRGDLVDMSMFTEKRDSWTPKSVYHPSNATKETGRKIVEMNMEALIQKIDEVFGNNHE
ncbi:MAG: creatininase family protein [Defluviitaleaceae bacterium]|nr:creatininase family protein [Defluviitaleaceae bacterium]